MPPIPLADVITDMRTRLTELPAGILGEVSIDHAARMPFIVSIDDD
jgi:hypothetical protein